MGSILQMRLLWTVSIDPDQILPFACVKKNKKKKQTTLLTVVCTHTPQLTRHAEGFETTTLHRDWICPYLELLLEGVDSPVVIGRKICSFPVI